MFTKAGKAVDEIGRSLEVVEGRIEGRLIQSTTGPGQKKLEIVAWDQRRSGGETGDLGLHRPQRDFAELRVSAGADGGAVACQIFDGGVHPATRLAGHPRLRLFGGGRAAERAQPNGDGDEKSSSSHSEPAGELEVG